ncbi:MAG: hypothetical protein GC200_08730 [Tepidisphaera sp.]|nr:hypothetical protein [Tepidisphaera sp.]
MLLKRFKITVLAVLAFLSCAYLLLTGWALAEDVLVPRARGCHRGRDYVRRVKHNADSTWSLTDDYGQSEFDLPPDELYVVSPFVTRVRPPISQWPFVTYSVDQWNICDTVDWTSPATIPLSDRVAILTVVAKETELIAPADVKALAKGPVVHRTIHWGGIIAVGLVFVSMGVAPLSLRALHRLRPFFPPTLGLCHTCKYDIRGLATDLCPECGSPLPHVSPYAGNRA